MHPLDLDPDDEKWALRFYVIAGVVIGLTVLVGVIVSWIN